MVTIIGEIKTKPKEFVKFHNALMSNAPKKYTPWYFPVVANNKAPDGYAVYKRAKDHCLRCRKKWVFDEKQKKWVCPSCGEGRGSWKALHARLTFEEALQRLKRGGNVGIAARSNDPLILIDIDDYKFLDQMPETLTIKSRKRSGLHGYCWEDKK